MTFFAVVGYYLITLLLILHGHQVISFSRTNSFQQCKTIQGARPQAMPPPVVVSVSSSTLSIVGGRAPQRITPSRHSPPLKASIVDQVTDEMKKAMRAKDTATLSAIRLIRSSFANAAIELRTESLTDDEARNVLKKMAKMRKESIDTYTKGGALDRAEMEQAELNIIERWLPAAADDQTVRVWVQEAIAEVGGGGTNPNMGKVMGALMKNHKNDNMDGNTAQRIVKEELAKIQL